MPVSDPRGGQQDSEGRAIPTTAQIQIGETRVRGIEIEGRGEITPGFDVIFAGTYTDALITEGAPAIAPVAASPTRRGSNGTPTTTGTVPLAVPEWQASAFLSYDFARGGASESALSGFQVGGGFRYVSGSFGATNYKVVNNETIFESFKTEGFTLFDAMVGYDLGHASPALDGFSLAVNAQNLFDKKHVSACPFSNSCYFGPPRTVIGSIRYKW